MNNIKKNLMRMFLGITILIYIALITFRPSVGTVSNLSMTISLSLIIYVVYTQFLWKYNPMHKSILLAKRYKGRLISEYDGNERDVNVEIRQTLFTVQVFLQTDESRSSTLMSDIVEENGEKFLVYHFINNPQAKYKLNSPIHYGLCRLSIEDTSTLSGQYFTCRKTIGDIFLNSY